MSWQRLKPWTLLGSTPWSHGVRITSVSPQRLNPEEVFEDQYTRKFQSRFDGQGLLIRYERDRAARDLGVQLTAPGSLELSNVRIWFQLKGIHASTLSSDEASARETVPAKVELEDVKNWISAPEAVYLVVYIESQDRFVGEDVRDFVDREFASIHGDGLTHLMGLTQKTIALGVTTHADIDEGTIQSMLRHRSMRIDGPTWRGKPLGHRFDPLRCELGNLEPSLFVEVVEGLLAAYDYQLERRMDAGRLLQGVADGTDEAFLSIGTLHSTYEWIFQMSVEFGMSPGTDFREEGDILRAQGRIAVLVHSRFGSHPSPAQSSDEVIEELRASGIKKILTIANSAEVLSLQPYKEIFGDMYQLPQTQGSLAYSLLTSPMVYMNFQERLQWKFVNYLWEREPEVVDLAGGAAN